MVSSSFSSHSYLAFSSSFLYYSWVFAKIAFLKCSTNPDFFVFFEIFLMIWKVSKQWNPWYYPSSLSYLSAPSIAGCSSEMNTDGSPFIISKKLLNTPLKSYFVSLFIRHMQKQTALLWLFFPRKSPIPHFFLTALPSTVSNLIYLMRLYVMSKEMNWFSPKALKSANILGVDVMRISGSWLSYRGKGMSLVSLLL